MKMKSYIEIKSVLALIFTLCSSYSQASSNNNILLELAEVKELIEQQNVTLVDARPFFSFKKNHISGAVSLPTDETYTKEGRSDLVASLTEMRELLSNAGIKEGSRVIVYGDNILDIARLFWVLETFGINSVAIMNGSFLEWKKLGYPTENGKGTVTKVNIYPTIKEEKLATMLMVFAAIKNDNDNLIDARTAQEYNGQQSQTAVRGHISSAVNIPWQKNLVKDHSSFRQLDELKELYKGMIKNKMNTVYCNEGKESAVSYVALRLVGANVRAYDGSWFEWSQHLGLPVVKGE